jgi:hypothetical protein
MSKITTYQVWSTHLEPDQHDELETRRTDKNVAYQDRELIQSILHRRAWVNEVQS